VWRRRAVVKLKRHECNSSPSWESGVRLLGSRMDRNGRMDSLSSDEWMDSRCVVSRWGVLISRTAKTVLPSCKAEGGIRGH
jgi:hypothetical protein